MKRYHLSRNNFSLIYFRIITAFLYQRIIAFECYHWISLVLVFGKSRTVARFRDSLHGLIPCEPQTTLKESLNLVCPADLHSGKFIICNG